MLPPNCDRRHVTLDERVASEARRTAAAPACTAAADRVKGCGGAGLSPGLQTRTPPPERGVQGSLAPPAVSRASALATEDAMPHQDRRRGRNALPHANTRKVIRTASMLIPTGSQHLTDTPDGRCRTSNRPRRRPRAARSGRADVVRSLAVSPASDSPRRRRPPCSSTSSVRSSPEREMAQRCRPAAMRLPRLFG